jgi:hypothetical protein
MVLNTAKVCFRVSSPAHTASKKFVNSPCWVSHLDPRKYKATTTWCCLSVKTNAQLWRRCRLAGCKLKFVDFDSTVLVELVTAPKTCAIIALCMGASSVLTTVTAARLPRETEHPLKCRRTCRRMAATQIRFNVSQKQSNDTTTNLTLPLKRLPSFALLGRLCLLRLLRRCRQTRKKNL